jgi:quercetin dioxygenase-like cupin family protein
VKSVLGPFIYTLLWVDTLTRSVVETAGSFIFAPSYWAEIVGKLHWPRRCSQVLSTQAGTRPLSYQASVVTYWDLLRYDQANPKHRKLDTIMNHHSITSQPLSAIPPDDLQRNLAVARPNKDQSLTHIGLVGDTYTILLTGNDTDGRYCLIDMLIPPGGGPGPHRHDFEESFTLLEGEIEFTFRDKNLVVGAGETVNIPANAPHSFVNSSTRSVRLLCICSPAGQEEFFSDVGIPVATRTTAAPKLNKAAQAAFITKAEELAPRYRTELLKP